EDVKDSSGQTTASPCRDVPDLERRCELWLSSGGHQVVTTAFLQVTFQILHVALGHDTGGQVVAMFSTSSGPAQDGNVRKLQAPEGMA
ncbi:Hypothetical predicted protein, partial [Marmota monax]